ncbi:MAG: anaerobic sulfatase maturase [Kiritimatiellae bacterium]|nr:anaerobic sulfatase maturase [Kiritimatiellia bacterium]
MKPFSLLIKPAGADCNLRCAYCFYLGRAELYPETTCHRMTEETLTRLVRSYLALPFPVHTFAFQGGEPLLMGEAFYRKLVTLQKRYARPGTRITNCIQTNGTLLTESMAMFFAQEHFLLGVSVDGPAAVHNLRRPNANGDGSHAMVMRGIDKLNAAQVEFNILTLVSQSNVHQPLEVYRYLRDTLGCRFMQFIECVEFTADGALTPDAITPDEWANFIITLFDEWYAHDKNTVSIRLFDSIVGKALTGNAHSCSMGDDCRAYFVVEHNGDVYPCDFFVRPELRLGNLYTEDWDELWDRPLHTAFGARKRQWNAGCSTCPYIFYCQGDCPKNRAGHDFKADATQRSWLCSAWQRIYAHILPPLLQEAEQLRKQS